MFDDFYGLTGKPFQLTPDPEFYFRSITHRKALSYLGYGLAQGEGFIVITGEIGAGKTTLLRHLLRSLPEDFTVGLISNAQGNRGELLHWVLMALGVPTDLAALAALHGADDTLARASVALRAVPGEFDLAWVGHLARAARREPLLVPLAVAMPAGEDTTSPVPVPLRTTRTASPSGCRPS